MSIKYQSKPKSHKYSVVKLELAILNTFQFITGSSLLLQLKASTFHIGKRTPSKRLPAFTVICILCLSAFFITIHQYEHYSSNSKDMQLEWNHLINLYGVLFASIVIIFEANHRNECFIHFLHIKRFVDHESRQCYGRKPFHQKRLQSFRKFLDIYAAFQLFCSLLEIFNMIVFYKHHIWIYYCLCQFSLLTFMNLRFFHQYFHIRSIHFYMRLIHSHIDRHILMLEHLEEMTKIQSSSYIELDRRSIVEELTHAQKMFDGIHQMADLSNKMFNLSMLSILMVSFLLFCTNVLWIYMQLDLNIICAIGKSLLFVSLSLVDFPRA